MTMKCSCISSNVKGSKVFQDNCKRAAKRNSAQLSGSSFPQSLTWSSSTPSQSLRRRSRRQTSFTFHDFLDVIHGGEGEPEKSSPLSGASSVSVYRKNRPGRACLLNSLFALWYFSSFFPFFFQDSEWPDLAQRRRYGAFHNSWCTLTSSSTLCSAIMSTFFSFTCVFFISEITE